MRGVTLALALFLGSVVVSASTRSSAESRYVADASLEWARLKNVHLQQPPPRAAAHRAPSAVPGGAAVRGSAGAGAGAGAGVHAGHGGVGGGSAVAAKPVLHARKGALKATGGHAPHKLADGGEEVGVKPFNPREAAATLQAWMVAHPDFAGSALVWILVGLLLLVVGLIVLTFSEVRVVLVVRDQDFRTDMSAGGYMDTTEKVAELEQREQDTVAARPYLTAGSMIVQFVACICILKPLCDVLDIIGIPSGNCFLTVAFGSFVCAVTMTTFVMALCWSCTRGWAALVLLLIAVSGDLLCPTGSPFLVVIWLCFSGAAFFYYFLWLPEQQEVPDWCQSIGPIKPSMDPVEWHKAAQSATKAGLADLKDASASIPGMKSIVGTAEGGGGKEKPTATV